MTFKKFLHKFHDLNPDFIHTYRVLVVKFASKGFANTKINSNYILNQMKILIYKTQEIFRS